MNSKEYIEFCELFTQREKIRTDINNYIRQNKELESVRYYKHKESICFEDEIKPYTKNYNERKEYYKNKTELLQMLDIEYKNNIEKTEKKVNETNKRYEEKYIERYCKAEKLKSEFPIYFKLIDLYDELLIKIEETKNIAIKENEKYAKEKLLLSIGDYYWVNDTNKDLQMKNVHHKILDIKKDFILCKDLYYGFNVYWINYKSQERLILHDFETEKILIFNDYCNNKRKTLPKDFTKQFQ